MNEQDVRDPWFGEQPIKRPGHTMLLETEFNRGIVEDVIKGQNVHPVRLLFFGKHWFIFPDRLCPIIKEVLSAKIQEADSMMKKQGPEPDGACLKVYFPEGPDIAEAIARELGIPVMTGKEGLTYIPNESIQQIRIGFDRRKANAKQS